MKRHYGLAGSIATLSSEVERTVEVNLTDGRRLILKTSTRPEAIDSFRFQTGAMAALQGAAGFVAPEMLRTGSGALMFEEGGAYGYLQSRIEGVPLHRLTATPDLLFRSGSALARLDLALERVDLPAAHRPVLWHIGCWSSWLNYGGQPQQSLAVLERAILLDPLPPVWFWEVKGSALFLLGRYAEAIDAYRNAGDQFFIHAFLAAAYAHLGEMENAHVAVEATLSRQPDLSLGYLAHLPFADPSSCELFLSGFRKAGFL